MKVKNSPQTQNRRNAWTIARTRSWILVVATLFLLLDRGDDAPRGRSDGGRRRQREQKRRNVVGGNDRGRRRAAARCIGGSGRGRRRAAARSVGGSSKGRRRAAARCTDTVVRGSGRVVGGTEEALQRGSDAGVRKALPEAHGSVGGERRLRQSTEAGDAVEVGGEDVGDLEECCSKR
ncbi:uncharacterized protein HKW66_Vig0005410 [Vigna angularis]|uniref:Uncharacterized protein n=1 Tax=Phaseolus angularis TaxID=3914 RepID=A0A8T0LCQ4_PHAAN|nr:uncharacterized protein HKW66_Vig0005410 [Vigna angularis]